ncbi:hypothetical protein [Pseudomonas sp. Marseille-P9899]|uniref:hypothetical protein n=1 Tax=Pseudomonas sp. Marseille-P9899 TaxID=2730401 RepID=UPI00158ED2C7|nr:hypothetical protein [Pseudomonas sp. Marseille-P9899]
MSDIIRNGSFTEGLDLWEADPAVEVGTYHQTNYAHLKPGTFISQEFGSVEGGIGWVFKLDTALLPLVGVPDLPASEQAAPLQKREGKKTKSKPSIPVRAEDDYSGIMFITMTDGEFYWSWSEPIPDYPWFGMTGFLFEAPVGAKSGQVHISLFHNDSPLGIDKAITKVELVKF